MKRPKSSIYWLLFCSLIQIPFFGYGYGFIHAIAFSLFMIAFIELWYDDSW